VDPKDRAPQILQFGVFEVDLAQGELRKFGRKIKLQDRPFQLLAALLERPGQVVTRDELVRRLWTDTLVDFDNGLNIAAKKVREALNDDASTPRYVETLPRRGYRFIAPVQSRAEPPAAAPEPPVSPVAPAPAATSFPKRRAIYVRSIGLAVALFLAVRIYWLATSVRPARLLQAVQLTQAGRAEYGDGVATDGSRIYFTEREGGRGSLAQVSAAGGTPLPMPVQLPNPDILDMSPDHGNLLVASDMGTDADRPLWIVPTAGSPRRLGDAVGHAGAWSRDGTEIVYARGTALFRVASDGSNVRKLMATPGAVSAIRWAPAPEREVLRFSAPEGLWEVLPDGSRLHRLLKGWQPGTLATDTDDGVTWAAGGKYFLFRSLRGGVTSVWAMRENRTFPRAHEGPPVQLYSSPMQFDSLAPSPDGRRVYFAAGQERRELARFDAGHRQFVPFLPGISAGWAAISKDERWLAYVTTPDRTLWRSRLTGGDRQQLTPPSFEAREPHWSPDGQQIVFTGGPIGEASRVYVIPAAGGAPEPVTAAPEEDTGASWSPDGSALLIARTQPSAGLYTLDRKTKQSALLPGSESLARAAWSPSARYIAATNRTRTEILLVDLQSRHWEPLAAGQGLGQPFWSHDSKFVYYQQVLGDPEQPIFRVPVNGTRRTPERMMSARQVPQSNAAGFLLVGLTADDAPMAAVIHPNSDIYALEVELP